MLRIRLRRVGKKKQPQYRLVVADARAPRDGRFVDIVGHYNPRVDPPAITVNEEKVRDWLGKGAQPSDTAAKLLARKGIIAASRNVRPGTTEAATAGAAAPAAVATAVPEETAAPEEAAETAGATEAE